MSLKNKKIAVTGAEGFIGSHLCDALLAEGCQVRTLALYNSLGHFGWLDDKSLRSNPRLEIVTGDIRDPHFMESFLESQQVVFHLASLIAIPFSYRSPDSYVDTNVRGALNVLQAARKAGVDRFVHTSTSETYGTAQYVPIDEKHPESAQSPYAATKIAADQLAMSFKRSFDLPVVTVRPFNAFGPRQSARAIIPTVITQLLAGKEEIQLGALTPTRDFTYVTDTAAGFIAAATADNVIGETINLGSGREIAIGELVDTIAKLMNKSVSIVTDQQRIRPEASEVDRLLCDASKAQKLLGWEPTLTLKEGLQKTIDWFAEPDNLAGYKTDIYNV